MKDQQGRLVVIAAPSGAGKGTLVSHLLDVFPWLSLSISATTRQEIRPGEQDGVHYYFISDEEFQKKIDNDEFLEWEEFYGGKRYGTLKSEISRIHGEDKVPLFELEVKGALSVKKIYGDRAELIFIKVPSVKVLENRLRARGTENEETIQTRMKRAEFELSFEEKFDHVIMNDDLEIAKRDIEELIRNIFPGRAV